MAYATDIDTHKQEGVILILRMSIYSKWIIFKNFIVTIHAEWTDIDNTKGERKFSLFFL